MSKKSDLITIIVAHRLSTVVNSDTIYVLEKGNIIEQGTHSKVLSENGLYAALWRAEPGHNQKLRSEKMR